MNEKFTAKPTGGESIQTQTHTYTQSEHRPSEA
jgi:hypothetical protein